MSSKINIVLAFLMGASIVPLFCQKENKNTEPYPFRNPVITHMYTADAAPHVMPDGRVWMVTSVDHEEGGGYATMHKYHTFSSADLVNWTDHGEILNIWDVLGADREPENEDWALWAPDMIYHQGKYYLYFPIRILHTDTVRPNGGRVVTSYIAVAESDAPDKKFKVVNSRIKGTRGIDPSVFIDDDGEKYLYYGSHWGSKLKENMIELDGPPLKMEVDDKEFMEAIWMNKRDGKYYVSYHKHYDKPIDPEKPDDPQRRKSRLDYGVSNSPLGPFSYQGILNYELGVNVSEGPKLEGKKYVPWRLYQSNHGGIVEFHGQEYLFYHTSALSSWRQDAFKGSGTWTQRSVCVDRIDYKDDGSIIPVQQSLWGVEAVQVKQAFRMVLSNGRSSAEDKIRINKKSIKVRQPGYVRYESIDLGSGYYYFGLELKNTTTKGKIELRLDRPDGQLVGTIPFNEYSNEVNDGRMETFLRGASGRHDIYLVFKLHNPGQLQIKDPEFFAGAPQK